MLSLHDVLEGFVDAAAAFDFPVRGRRRGGVQIFLTGHKSDQYRCIRPVETQDAQMHKMTPGLCDVTWIT